MFLNFEIANITPKFKNKFHYKMRFFKKNKLYKIFFILFYLCVAHAQPTHQPGILLKSNTQQAGQYYFYTAQEDAVSLHKINTSSEYYKIWEYVFLDKKDFTPVSLLFGDVTGNGEQEFIVVGNVFGGATEIYIFQTDNNIPVSEPAIYEVLSLKRGSRPTKAELVMWDGDKDHEIVMIMSSPDRSLIVLDYNINTLQPIKHKVATRFMENTYGPVEMLKFDYNQNNQDDLILYTTSTTPEQHIYTVSTKKEETKKISKLKIDKFKIIKDQDEIYEILITQDNKVYLAGDKKIILENPTIDLLKFNNNFIVQITPQEIKNIELKKEDMVFEIKSSTTIPISDKNINYLYNTSQNIMLFYDKGIKNPKIVFIKENLEWQNLTKIDKQKKEIVKKPDKSMEDIIKGVVQQEKEDPVNTVKDSTGIQDSLYVNTGDVLKISINTANPENITSVETNILPKGMILNPEAMEFEWSPEQTQIGENVFQYSIVSETSPTLKVNQEDSSKLTLERITQTQNKNHKHMIFVNDIPKLILDNNFDTINVEGSFNTPYSIQDQFVLTEYKIDIIQPTKNTLLIDNGSIYWEPTKNDVGLNEFLVQLSDGLAQDTARITVVVDTTVKVTQTNLLATLNQEFIYELPHQPGYTYNILNAPNNLRITPKGKVYWIPLATQVDNNVIEININTGTTLDKHKFNVYVNAPPVISYRPAQQEYITKGDSFRFIYQSFDLNLTPNLNWSLELVNPDQKNQFILNEFGKLTVATDSLIDNQDYIVVLSDGINNDKFFGTLYVNAIPQIVSTPPDYLVLGDTLEYQIKVEDLNKEKPFSSQYLSSSTNKIEYSLEGAPINASIDSAGLLFWVPGVSQLGSHNFDVLITDSLTTANHSFSLFVNDKPNIISVDSLSIMVGDTLNHFFDASDLNSESSLIYSIKTTIDELMFSGKAGKLTWIPQLDDIGVNTLEISVSDGFSLSTDTQKLKVFVYVPPRPTNMPDSTAYVNLEYVFSPKAQDMYLDSVYNKDIFIEFLSPDTLFNGFYNHETNTLKWTPLSKDLGLQKLQFIIKDKYNTTSAQRYNVNVLMSPCDISDTLYVNQVDTVYIKTSKNQSTQKRSPFSPFP